MGLAALTALVTESCTTAARAARGEDASLSRNRRSAGRTAGTPIRVVLAAGREPTISGTGEWEVSDAGGLRSVLTARGGDARSITIHDGHVAVTASTGASTGLEPPVVVRPLASGSLVILNGRRYRGDMVVTPTGAGVRVVNRVPVEDYLRGVVALEIGSDAPREAMRAQAVAARTYALSRRGKTALAYDLTATVVDQVYGGVDAENPPVDAAVAQTGGEVLLYEGRLASAPYHSTCGGTTAGASEAWPGGGAEPYLRPVSDRVPGTDALYCDDSPFRHWSRRVDEGDVRARLARYARGLTMAGRVRDVVIVGRTSSGRASAVSVRTEEGDLTLRPGEIRDVFRASGGAMLPSTYFSLTVERAPDRTVTSLHFVGRGNGHGVGMCQWGAMGRARAGQGYRTILQTYYPGTTIGVVD
ncbi:MAG: hypothetical protein NVS9B3_01330 [Gemmatimonadaceae bacterium]